MLPAIYKQIYGATDVICLVYVNGFIIGIITVMTPSLRRPGSGIKLTADEESWIASLPFLLMFPAQCVGAFAAERIGRRRVVTFALLIPAVSCVLIGSASGATALLAAAAITGLTAGGTGIGTVLIAEIASPKHRGILLNIKMCAIVLGFFTAHLLGKFFDWRRLVLLGVAPCVLGLVVSSSSPESPAWLAARGRFRECARAFQWLRGDGDVAELRALVHAQRAARRDASLHTERSSLRRTAQYLTDKCFLQASLISVACVLIMELIGISMMYIIDILTAITGDKENVHYYAAGMDIQGIICLFLSVWLVKRFRRRSMLFISGIAAICFQLLFCLLLYMFDRGVIPSSYVWTKMTSLMLYCMMRDVGLQPVVHDVLGEVFPLSHRWLGVAFIGFTYTTLTFVGVKILPSIISQFGIHGLFLQIAIVTVLSMIYLYFYLPETSNKTLQNIEYEMAGKTCSALKGSQVVLDEDEVCLTTFQHKA